MYNWLLFFILLVMAYVTWFINRKCFLAPSFIVTGIMALSTLIVAMNTNYWGYTISLKTVLIISVSCLMFCVGEAFGKRFFLPVSVANSIKMKDYELRTPASWMYLLAMVFAVGVFALYFLQQYRNAAMVGATGSLADIVSANRFSDSEQMQSSSFIRLLFLGLKVLSYAAFVIFINNREMGIEKRHGKETFIILLVYAATCVMSSNRGDIIAMASSIAFYIFYFAYKKANWNTRRANKKTVITVVLIIVLALVAFRMLGYLTGKSEKTSAYDNICTYMGSSIICFDKYVNGTSNLPEDFRVTLISALRGMLKRLGFPIEFTGMMFPHQYWGVTKRWGSNVFTSFFPFMKNYGIVGLFLAQLLLGAVYGMMWRKLKSSDGTWPFVIIYGDLFFYYICMYSIAERLFSQLFTLTGFVEIAIAIVLVRFLKRRKTTIPNPNSESNLPYSL